MAVAATGEIVKGEARVVSLNERMGFLSCPKLDGKIFIIPSSLKSTSADSPWPSLIETLCLEDIVTFEAVRQTERAGAKYLAIDGTVKLKKRSQNSAYEGDGTITSLDLSRGVFGFLENSEIGSAYFSVAAVRPKTEDANKIFKIGKRVRFIAVPIERSNSTSKWKATLVCPMNKAGEFIKKQPPVVERRNETVASRKLDIGRIRATSGASLASSEGCLEFSPRFSSNSPLTESNSFEQHYDSPRGYSMTNLSRENSTDSHQFYETNSSLVPSNCNSPENFCVAFRPFPKPLETPHLAESGGSQFEPDFFDNAVFSASDDSSSSSSAAAANEPEPVAHHCSAMTNRNYDNFKAYTMIAQDIIMIAHELDENI